VRPAHERRVADAAPKKKRGGSFGRKRRAYPDLSKPLGDLAFEVHLPQHGQRLDRFLAERLSWRSRTKAQELIRSGHVLVRGEPARKPAQRVLAGDAVLVRNPTEPPPDTLKHEELAGALEIVHEDGHILALAKPPGVVCHPVGKVRYNTLVNALHVRYRHADPALDRVPRLCHRLDKETSGLILVALAPGVRKRMQWVFESRKVVKEYLALVEGLWALDYDEVDLPIGRALDSPIRIKRGVDPEEGLPSRTIVCVEERFEPARDGSDRGFTLVRASPVTGRQHQIRVHVAARGHPVLGDTMYGPKGLAFRGFPDPERTGGRPPLIARHALHAFRVQLPHPITGLELDLRAPLPPDFRAALEHLRARKASGSPVRSG